MKTRRSESAIPVAVVTGGFLNASSQCRTDALNFKLKFMPAQSPAGNPTCDYLNIALPRMSQARLT
eukprot:565527-Prymnesium_polylepis.1